MKFFSWLSLTILIAACSSKEPEKKPIVYPEESPEVSTTNPEQTSITARQTATGQGSNFVSEFKFKRGQTKLTLANQKTINKVFKRAENKGEIEEVQVVTWADEKFPTQKQKDLSESQQNLVNKRNASIKKHLKKLNHKLEVKTISMAKRADALDRFTASDEAKIKEGLDQQDAPDKVSESMVIFILKK